MNRTDMTREEIGSPDGWNARGAADAAMLDAHIDTLVVSERGRLRPLVALLDDEEELRRIAGLLADEERGELAGDAEERADD